MGWVLPSLMAKARANDDCQRVAPSVPPRRDRSEFNDKDAYKAHMKERRKAQERLREFNRPRRLGRSRAGDGASGKADVSTKLVTVIDSLLKNERRTLWRVNDAATERLTGRKQAPDLSIANEPLNRIINQTEHLGRVTPAEAAVRHATNQRKAAQRLQKLTSAKKIHAALQDEDEWHDVTISQVRRALTAVRKGDDPELIKEDRRKRHSIQKRVSSTRPAVYPARLHTQREARRPQVETREAERAQKRAQRDQDKVARLRRCAACGSTVWRVFITLTLIEWASLSFLWG